MLKLRRMPAALALLLAAFAGVSAAGAPRDHRPEAEALIEAPALLPADGEAGQPAQPGDSDPPDSGDSALRSAGPELAVPARGFTASPISYACSAPLCAGYRARAPPSP